MCSILNNLINSNLNMTHFNKIINFCEKGVSTSDVNQKNKDHKSIHI
jgi:hypothetical protein